MENVTKSDKWLSIIALGFSVMALVNALTRNLAIGLGIGVIVTIIVIAVKK